MRDGGSPRNRLLKFASEGMEAQREGAREARGLCAHRGLAALCAGPGFPPSPWRGDLELCWGQQEEGTVGLIPTICHLSTLPGAQHVGFSRGREGDGIRSGPAGVQRGPGSSRLTCASSTRGLLRGASGRRPKVKVEDGEEEQNCFPQDPLQIFLLPLTHFHTGDRRERDRRGRGRRAVPPPQTSDPINGLAWGQAAWPQRPLCPAASHPHCPYPHLGGSVAVKLRR